MENFKFRTLNKDGTNEMFEYNDDYCIEEYTNYKRIVIAPKKNQMNLMLEIAKGFEQPLGILYVLVVPRVDSNESGRYQSPYPLEFEEVEVFCNKFKEFLESDGRHHFWIASINSKGINQLLVYDKHNVIYVYDDIDKITNFLKKKNFNDMKVKFPVPHTHMYNAENDMFEKEILEYFNWRVSPLQENDN